MSHKIQFQLERDSKRTDSALQDVGQYTRGDSVGERQGTCKSSDFDDALKNRNIFNP